MMRLLPAAAFVLVAAACSSDQGAPSVDTDAAAIAAESDPIDGIDWFDGSVDEALAAAEESGKPVYLYWGAEWCPPCHAIAATVFKSPEFIERSKLFVPVYLDGDDENAQAEGERFGVIGYPTMIVLDADGSELTRIPSGIDIRAYANILDLTLSNSSSAGDVTAALMAGETGLSKDDCSLLAYNSWGQDTRILVEHDSFKAFRRMYEACPVDMTVERSILYMNWLDAALDATEAEDEARPLTGEEQAEALAMLRSMLDDHELARANVVAVLIDGARVTAALTQPDSDERAALTHRFLSAYDALMADESVYKRERIYTVLGKILFERIDDEEAGLSADLQQEIREMAAWADASTPSVYERQPIINAVANVLAEAGMDDVAMAMLLAEVERSKQGYYFMPDIADIEQRAGNYEVAIMWLRRAYNESRGPATRFQWGNYYLSGLLEMKPEDAELIRSTTIGLIEELQSSGGFFQRPKRQLKSLEGKLVAWSEENNAQATLDTIRESVLAICKKADESCTTFLQPS